MVVTQLINNKGNAVANQIIKTNGLITTFQSYANNICEIDKETKTIIFGKDYNYSNTTIRHRNKFLADILGEKISSTEVNKMLNDGSFNEYIVAYNENL